MNAYIKKIAVIKQVKSGFSADGGNLSGLVKAETYAGFLKVEVSLINFAPLTEGRYVFGISDGLNTVIFEEQTHESECPFSLASGFAFLVCFCNHGVSPIASAACGQMACALPDLKEEMARTENVKPKPKGAGAAYDDEAISEVNYYERADEGGTAVRQAAPPETDGGKRDKDEEAARVGKGAEGGGRTGDGKDDRTATGGGAEQSVLLTATDAADGGAQGGLAGGDFYSRMEGDVRRIFSSYPKEPLLERAMEGSRFVRISYGDGKYYAFGVLCIEGKPRYICYGVPATGTVPPVSLKDIASYVPVDGGGYWMTYQDAATGVSVKLTVE